jgi:hypothetical protein
MISKIEEQFTASHKYTLAQFSGFLMDANIGLSSFISIEIIAYTTFKSHLND